MLRFRNLDEIAEYIETRKQIAAMWDELGTDYTDAQAHEVLVTAERMLQDYWDSLDY